MSAWIFSPPKIRNRLSSSERKYRVEPGSPWRPARPRSWLSTRRDSWRSVPTTCKPPSACTSAFSAVVTTLNSASIALNAARSFSAASSSVGAFSHANESLSSASSASTARSPQPATAASTPSLSNRDASAESSHG